jgi:hypothetical protein
VDEYQQLVNRMTEQRELAELDRLIMKYGARREVAASAAPPRRGWSTTRRSLLRWWFRRSGGSISSTDPDNSALVTFPWVG